MGNGSKNEFNKNLYNNIVPHIIRLETEKQEMENVNTSEYYGNEMDPLKIHNKYIGIMKLLEGKDDSNSSKKKTGIKGEDVFPRLNLNNVDYEKIARVLILYGEITDEINETYDSNKSSNKNNRKVPNQKFLSNLKKITLKHDKKFVEKLMVMAEMESNNNCEPDIDIKALKKNYDDWEHKIEADQKAKFNKYAKKLKLKKKYYKRNRTYHPKLFNQFTENSKKNLDKIKQQIYTCGDTNSEQDKICIIWQELNSSFLYVNFYCWTILQSVISNIFRNLEMKNKCENMERIKDFIDVKIKEFYDAEKDPVEIERGKEYYYISLFFLFMYRRSEFLLNIKVLNSLKEQSKDIKEPDSKYKVDITGPFELDKDTISLFSEGKKMSKSTEYNRYKENEKILELFKKQVRKFYNDSTCHKAVYRMLCENKLSYEGISIRGMFSNYLKDKTYFDENDKYYFFDEAANMAINRERGQLNEYWCKNKMQESLYHLAVLVLSRLNPKEIIKKTDHYFNDILDVIENILEEERYKNQL